MGAVASMIYSGAVEEVGAMIVSGAFSSVRSRYETQEGLDVILFSLQHEVCKIKSAINIARGRRITDQQLLEWLAEIIKAAYRGEYYYRTFKNWSSHPPMLAGTKGTGNLLIDPISRPTKRQRAIRTLLFDNDKHRELHDALKMLKSIDIYAFLQMVNALPERPMKRYLYMEPNRLINRCKEREEVMKFLFEPSKAGENNVDILPIVGPRGVGKTTLSLHCFYDPKVQNQFSLKIYIPSSFSIYSRENFLSDPPSIFQRILKELNNTWITNFDKNTLLAMLKQNLSSEKLLLVMDDVWDFDSEVWYALLGCLRCAKQGSKVIFISDSYAKDKNIRRVGTVKPIMIEGFSEDEYMLFFKDHAFGSADAEDHPELAKMGEEIAKKVNGSIWGAKILGEILRDNLNAPFWSFFFQDGFLSSQFLHSKGLWPVIETISKLLSKRLRVETLFWSYGESGVLPGSFRELMVLSPKDCTHVINEGKNYRVKFLVTKHFNLHNSIVFYAEGKLTEPSLKKKVNGSIWGAKILGEILRDNLNAIFWSIFLQDGFLSSAFLYSKGLWPVIETISQLLPKRLRVESLGISYGESGVLPRSFRELMVLSPKYWTPVINERKKSKNRVVRFLVTKHFNLHETIDFYANCELIGDESDLD